MIEDMHFFIRNQIVTLVSFYRNKLCASLYTNMKINCILA